MSAPSGSAPSASVPAAAVGSDAGAPVPLRRSGIVGHVDRLVERAMAWLVPAVPRNRLAVMRLIAYVFALADVFWFNASLPMQHARLPAAFYRPLHVGRMLHLPTPTPAWVWTCRFGLVAFVVVVLAGKIPRLGGVLVAACYFEWAVIFNSYGKVNHDRLGFTLLLLAIPTAGHLSLRDTTPDERAGWVLRITQMGAVGTYFLAAIDKVRFTGWNWVNGGEFERAVARRGTFLAKDLAKVPQLFHVSQYFMLAGELLAWMLWSKRWGKKCLLFAFVFHVVTFATITIGFWPHQISLLAFLPLEVGVLWWDRLRRPRADEVVVLDEADADADAVERGPALA